MSDLFTLFITPLIISAAAFLLPFLFRSTYGKIVAVALSLIPLALLIYGQPHWIGTSVSYKWLPPLGINFHLAVDSLSLVFLYLTAIIIPISFLALPKEGIVSSNTFYGMVFLLQGLLIGFFTARDLVVFTIFWESMLLPLFFIISYWGGAKRRAAALKFLVYMIAGSTLMVIGVLALHFATLQATGTSTFGFDLLGKTAETAPHAGWLFFIFLLAFCVKTPLFPFHGWLPDAYCQASTSGTILLSAILSKAGIYGIVRIGLGFFPTFMVEWGHLLLGLAIVGVFYGGLSAWVQNDFKRLIAYSSFSHVNFILVGLFVANQIAHEGAVLQALNHGVTIAALFLVAGWLEERIGSTAISRFSGAAKYLPHLCWLTLFFVLSSVALPGTNNFIGEFMILFGLFTTNPLLTAVLGLSVILSVIYMLRWMQKVYFGTPHLVEGIGRDIGWREISIALPLVFLVLWVGVYPTPVLNQILNTVRDTIVLETP
ncbi:MAG: NADH-quinone oxidoreductase subunit M [Parachlamydiaceae bacterium]